MRLDELTEDQYEENHVAEQRMIGIVEHHLRVLRYVSENCMFQRTLDEITLLHINLLGEIQRFFTFIKKKKIHYLNEELMNN